MAERQSPVDIPPEVPIHRDGLELCYGPTALTSGDNPNAVQVDNVGEAHAIIDGTRYGLLQLHMHCPSEHTFGGTRTAMELHFVHAAADERLAVVGVTFVEGRENPALAAILSGSWNDDAPVTIDLDVLVPADRAYVAYEGSLTTPPYSEDVAWRVLIRANTLSAVQLRALKAIHDHNARAVQPMSGRTFE